MNSIDHYKETNTRDLLSLLDTYRALTQTAGDRLNRLDEMIKATVYLGRMPGDLWYINEEGRQSDLKIIELAKEMVTKLKETLATREHIPNKVERKRLRQEKAKSGGDSRSRNR